MTSFNQATTREINLRYESIGFTVSATDDRRRILKKIYVSTPHEQRGEYVRERKMWRYSKMYGGDFSKKKTVENGFTLVTTTEKKGGEMIYVQATTTVRTYTYERDSARAMKKRRKL